MHKELSYKTLEGNIGLSMIGLYNSFIDMSLNVKSETKQTQFQENDGCLDPKDTACHGCGERTGRDRGHTYKSCSLGKCERKEKGVQC